MLAVCGPMRPGLEGELLQGVQAWQPQARIVGVTSSVLYGTSVSLVLLHRPRVGNHLPAVPEVDELLPGADLQMPWARWQSDRQLGRIGLDPGLLLRVKVRAVDRPVLAASTLAGLERALTARIALGRGTSGIQVWYARSRSSKVVAPAFVWWCDYRANFSPWPPGRTRTGSSWSGTCSGASRPISP